MYLVGFSRRCRPPVMQRQMLGVQRQLLLMFKVMQGDRLIKRRLREAPGPSFSHREGLVTNGSRVLLPRYKGRWIKMFHQKHHLTYKHTHLFHPPSPWPQRSTGFTIVQVFPVRRLIHVLIKPDICSGTVAKSHKGELAQKRWGCWPFVHLSYWIIQIQCAPPLKLNYSVFSTVSSVVQRSPGAGWKKKHT